MAHLRAILLTTVFLTGWTGDLALATLPPGVTADVPMDWPDEGYVPISLRNRADVQERIETAATVSTMQISWAPTDATTSRWLVFADQHFEETIRPVSLFALQSLRW